MGCVYVVLMINAQVSDMDMRSTRPKPLHFGLHL